MIRDAIAAGTSQYGMQTFDQSLFHLFQSGLISMEEALHNASNSDEFRMRVSGILVLRAGHQQHESQGAPGASVAQPDTSGDFILQH